MKTNKKLRKSISKNESKISTMNEEKAANEKSIVQIRDQAKSAAEVEGLKKEAKDIT